MASLLLIGDNNLSKFWPAYQFSRPNLKFATLSTATDLDTLDNALSQTDEKDQVIISVLTSILLEELNQHELASSVSNVFDQVLARLSGLCPQNPSCQFFLAPPEKTILPRWFSSSYQKVYEALVKIVPRFPANLHLLPIYATDFTMFESGKVFSRFLFSGRGSNVQCAWDLVRVRSFFVSVSIGSQSGLENL